MTPLALVLLDVLGRLPAHADELRDLDAALGDGDLGVTVTAGSAAAAAEIARDPSATDAVLLQRIGAAFAGANPSTFAALVGGGVIAASTVVTEGGLARPGAPAEFGAAVQQRIAERGHAKVGDKTVLDALDASLSVLRGSRVGAVETLGAMVAAVDEAVERLTPERSARGRASWLQERSIGLRDPGMIAYRTFLVELRSVLAAEEQ